jgi:DHA2 family multidrug resistance protein
MSVGPADIRGALHLGVDEGAWINTAFNASAEVLGLQVRQQAYTLAISDSFLLLATCCVACLVVVSFMSRVPTQYRQVTAAPVEAK